MSLTWLAVKNVMDQKIFFFLLVVSQIINAVEAFGVSSTIIAVRNRPASKLFADPSQLSEPESILSQSYPSFYKLVVQPSEEVVKTLRKNASLGFTIFCPNEAAFAKLGEKKCDQLKDPRNLETVEKIAAYHIVGDEKVSAETLSSDSIGGVMTMGGAVDIGPSRSGGIFGFGAKDDGGVVVGPGARIITSYSVGPGVIHEMDGLVSPSIIWRYMDQLRIPGLQK